MDTIKKLYDFFPTSVFTGNSMVFISEDWKVELTEHQNKDFSRTTDSCAIIRVKISKRALNGDFIAGGYQDFEISNLGQLAMQIEKYIQSAVGKTIRENPDDGWN